MLYGFKKKMEQVSKTEDKSQKEKAYMRWAILRITLIGTGALLAISAFYLLGKYNSMLWCAAIVLVALYFCKPTDKKIYMEMNDIREDSPSAM